MTQVADSIIDHLDARPEDQAKVLAWLRRRSNEESSDPTRPPPTNPTPTYLEQSVSSSTCLFNMLADCPAVTGHGNERHSSMILHPGNTPQDEIFSRLTQRNGLKTIVELTENSVVAGISSINDGGTEVSIFIRITQECTEDEASSISVDVTDNVGGFDIKYFLPGKSNNNKSFGLGLTSSVMYSSLSNKKSIALMTSQVGSSKVTTAEIRYDPIDKQIKAEDIEETVNDTEQETNTGFTMIGFQLLNLDPSVIKSLINHLKKYAFINTLRNYPVSITLQIISPADKKKSEHDFSSTPSTDETSPPDDTSSRFKEGVREFIPEGSCENLSFISLEAESSGFDFTSVDVGIAIWQTSSTAEDESTTPTTHPSESSANVRVVRAINWLPILDLQDLDTSSCSIIKAVQSPSMWKELNLVVENLKTTHEYEDDSALFCLKDSAKVEKIVKRYQNSLKPVEPVGRRIGNVLIFVNVNTPNTRSLFSNFCKSGISLNQEIEHYIERAILRCLHHIYKQQGDKIILLTEDAIRSKHWELRNHILPGVSTDMAQSLRRWMSSTNPRIQEVLHQWQEENGMLDPSTIQEGLLRCFKNVTSSNT